MSAAHALDGTLSPAEWEHRLVVHYLRSDGPSGGAPLSFLDATPAEIATASGIEGIGDHEAQQAFVAHFSRSSIEGWLSGDYGPPARDADVPTYFRFLVLTCLVSATDTGAGSTHNFRIRLGELLDADGPFHAVDGVNELWRSVARWCDRKRAAGEPFRRIVLPDPGHATLIGHAVRIAFPSWRDRSALTQILRRLSPATRRTPERLVQELARSNYSHLLPNAVAVALDDFATSIRARRRMLFGHRFWRLVQSIEVRLADEEGDPRSLRWRLDVRFGGYEQDEVSLALFRGRAVLGEQPAWEGSIQQLADLRAVTLPTEIAEALRQGVLMLSEAPGATWSMGDSDLPMDCTVVILARAESLAASWPLDTTWRSLEAGWLVSGKLDPHALTGLRRRLGLAPATGLRLVDLSFADGVKTGHSTWLGRPAFLPTLTASQGSTVSLESIGVTTGSLTLSGRAPTWSLLAEKPIAGRWRVRAIESALETEQVICFEEEVPERWEFPAENSTFESERELLVTGEMHEEFRRTEALSEEPVDELLWDILEAVYASPPRGWAENVLIKMLQSVLPTPHFEWDFLRSLAEGDWLEPVVSTSWRARIWRLRSPYFEVVTPHMAVVRGALGTAARRRLGDAAAATGSQVIVRAGVSAWAPPTVIVQGDIRALSNDLAWTIQQHRRPHVDAAPACWPVESRTGQGRLLKGIWRFDLGLFLAPDKIAVSEGSVRLERLVRERGDDRDLYRIIDNDKAFLTTSRTLAVLEAYRRRKESLFDWTSKTFVRRFRGGHLPMPIARTLAIRSLRASGPVLRLSRAMENCPLSVTRNCPLLG
ncbi:hypothetical protein [Bradyrhizobium zhanjiangense]|uniref:hypothetical protein n=1 Tax=Bradyrhizobium zhanjiangense TaxID=1325107 RepID=UPI0013E8B7F2|nr:hypothetical protein [Bradyrhizobium zhanjiangense]